MSPDKQKRAAHSRVSVKRIKEKQAKEFESVLSRDEEELSELKAKIHKAQLAAIDYLLLAVTQKEVNSAGVSAAKHLSSNLFPSRTVFSVEGSDDAEKSVKEEIKKLLHAAPDFVKDEIDFAIKPDRDKHSGKI